MPGELIYPYGAVATSAVIKSTASDFEVEEVLGFEPSGDGEHLFLWIEKSGLSTPELVTRIARDGGIDARAISYSGLKDKHAVTRQWLSLHLPGKDLVVDSAADRSYRVLRRMRHHRKLRRGTHRANRFCLRLREVSEPAAATWRQMQCVAKQGFANYFGHQRFGSKQDNPRQALQQLHTRRLSRTRRGLLLSALRSQLFNVILSRRIELGYWLEPLHGDVFMLRGSHSIFSEPPTPDLLARYRHMDISSCASLYGSGETLMSAAARELEQAVFDDNRELTDCLERQGSRLQMRPLRAIAEAFSYDYDSAAGTLALEFSLSAGSYATSLLSHFVEVRDASQSGARR